MRAAIRFFVFASVLWVSLSGVCAARGKAAPKAAEAQAYAWFEDRDYARARAAYALAARQGFAWGQFNYAMMLKNGQGGLADPAEAAVWLKRAADQNFTEAWYVLGLAYEHGELFPRSLAVAHRCYVAAAELGHASAQMELGTQYLTGVGAPQNDERAAHWYLKAAQGGDAVAQYILASLYERGAGLAQDLGMAVHWYRKAAAQGDAGALAKVQSLTRDP